ncbi:MAG: hypothetical protein KC766_02305 [Myxococcales bacterium]|nr:hypothetical protein [Myxococcales bacterium]
MTTRTLAILFSAGLLGACGGSSGSDLFANGGSGGGGSGGTGATSAGGSAAGGSSASGGSSGDAGAGNAGSGGDGGVGGSSIAGSGGTGEGGTSAGGTSGGTGGSGVGGAVAGSGGSAGTGTAGTSTTGGTGGSTAGTGGTSTAGTGGTGTAGTGGVLGDPGVVTCNGGACRVDQGNKCCVPWYGWNPTGKCIGENDDCDGNGFQDLKNDITCNGPEDCQMGQHCCGEVQTIGIGGGQRTVYDRLSCKNSCGNGEVTVCGAFPSECGSNQVCAQSDILESGYKICRNN